MAGNPRPVVLAAIAGAHGVSGAVRLKLFAQSLDALQAHAQLTAGDRQLTLQSLRETGRGPIAHFAEITDRTAAEALRGTLLSVPRHSLPALAPGEYYWHDLLNLSVFDEDGMAAGEVVAVENFGASDLLDIACPDGRRVLVPMIAAAVPEFDARRITVRRSYLDAG